MPNPQSASEDQNEIRNASDLANQPCHWPLRKKRGVPANSFHFTGFGRSENTTQVTTLVSLILPRDAPLFRPIMRVRSA